MASWNTKDRGRTRENRFTTSYGDENAQGDYDGKSCSDFHQLPGRGIEDVEDLTMLHGLGLKEMDDQRSTDDEDEES